MVSAQKLWELAGDLEAYVVDCRRHIHGLAELSGEEVATSAFIRKELDSMGIPWTNPTPTSVLGVIDTGLPGRCVALRSDIDALPIVECPENLAGPRTCVSHNPATCHACGHDGHSAMLLGAARALATLRDEGGLTGTVLLCFESAEETMTGFAPMLAALESYPLESVWGIHLYADLESGKICVDAGSRMAGAASLDVVVHGVGGHGSRPDMAKNPVFAAASLLNNLAVAWVNQLSPEAPVTLGATTIEGGGRLALPRSRAAGASTSFLKRRMSRGPCATLTRRPERRRLRLCVWSRSTLRRCTDARPMRAAPWSSPTLWSTTRRPAIWPSGRWVVRCLAAQSSPTRPGSDRRASDTTCGVTRESLRTWA